MDINIILTFFESNLYLFLLIIPFFSQLGVPLGAMFFILFAGALANNLSELILPFLLVLISTVTGDLLGYFIGRKFFKFKSFQNLLNKKIIRNIYKKSKDYFKKRGEISIFLSRFLIAGIGPTINYVSGIQLFSFKKFSFYVILGEVIYAFQGLILGYIFKDSFEEIFNIISNFGKTILIAFILYEVGKHLFWNKHS